MEPGRRHLDISSEQVLRSNCCAGCSREVEEYNRRVGDDTMMRREPWPQAEPHGEQYYYHSNQENNGHYYAD
jgi:hypothetical protein